MRNRYTQWQLLRERGLGVSLFRLLSEHHPNSMVMLDEQYRMNSDIMLLSNTLFYNHQLKCGSVGVASGRLALPLPQCLSHDCPRWLRRCLSPDTPVIFLNTDKLEDGSESSGCGEKIWNKSEVEIVTKLISSLLQCGVTGDQVGVVTPYRHQQTKIKEALANLPLTQCGTPSVATPSAENHVEVNTVDRYQGRDKDCIIISYVRSNPNRNVGNLLCDWRRVNVALTRARHKMVMVGSLSTLSSSPPLLSLIHLLTDKHWTTDIID
jgi:DNA replication ATP-dependent helicase Dna2